MQKWYTVLLATVLTVTMAACSGGEEEAPAADDPAETTETAEAEHSHGDGEHGHTHAETADLGPEVSKLVDETLEVACGNCIYGMEGVAGCELATMIDDEPFLVTGVGFDTHSSGICKEASTANITGTVHEKGVHASKVELTD